MVRAIIYEAGRVIQIMAPAKTGGVVAGFVKNDPFGNL